MIFVAPYFVDFSDIRILFACCCFARLVWWGLFATSIHVTSCLLERLGATCGSCITLLFSAVCVAAILVDVDPSHQASLSMSWVKHFSENPQNNPLTVKPTRVWFLDGLGQVSPFESSIVSKQYTSVYATLNLSFSKKSVQCGHSVFEIPNEHTRKSNENQCQW